MIHFPSALAEPLYGKANPFPAEITELVNLNGSRSGKQTIHLELSLEGSGLSFEPGNSLGIVTENRPETVEAVLQAAGLAGDVNLAARLAREWDVTTLSRQVIEAHAALNPAPALAELIAGESWRGYVPGRRLLDLLEDFPLALTPKQLTGLCASCRRGSIPSLPRRRPRPTGRTCWSAWCATRAAGASATASPRPSSPSGCGRATS